VVTTNPEIKAELRLLQAVFGSKRIDRAIRGGLAHASLSVTTAVQTGLKSLPRRWRELIRLSFGIEEECTHSRQEICCRLKIVPRLADEIFQAGIKRLARHPDLQALCVEY
jgi:hypothetical protein